MKDSLRAEYLEKGLEVFYESVLLLFDITKEELKGRDKKLYVPLVSCCNTALGVYKLLNKDIHTENEAYMLLRSLLEKLVNYQYLRHATEEEFDKYFLYPFYRMYHSTLRELRGNKFKIKVELDRETRETFAKDPNIIKALDIFSKTNPTMRWTDKTFSQRVNAVCENDTSMESLLLISSMVTYSDASEVLHGSFYGNLVLTGMFTFGTFADPKKPTQKEINENISLQLTLPLMLICKVMLKSAEDITTSCKIDGYKTRIDTINKKTLPILKRADS